MEANKVLKRQILKQVMIFERWNLPRIVIQIRDAIFTSFFNLFQNFQETELSKLTSQKLKIDVKHKNGGA